MCTLDDISYVMDGGERTQSGGDGPFLTNMILRVVNQRSTRTNVLPLLMTAVQAAKSRLKLLQPEVDKKVEKPTALMFMQGFQATKNAEGGDVGRE
jgi:hypothetical protein